MKLLYHQACNDLFKLDYIARTCRCGQATGAYNANGDTAWYNGKGIILVLDNYFMKYLVRDGLSVMLTRREDGDGKVTVKEKP